MKKKGRIKELETLNRRHDLSFLQIDGIVAVLRDDIHNLRGDVEVLKDLQNQNAERLDQLDKLVSDFLKEGENEREKSTEESPGVLE